MQDAGVRSYLKRHALAPLMDMLASSQDRWEKRDAATALLKLQLTQVCRCVCMSASIPGHQVLHAGRLCWDFCIGMGWRWKTSARTGTEAVRLRLQPSHVAVL